MPIVLLIVIVGTAAGFLATRLMRVQADALPTIAIGIAGSVIGWFALQLLVAVTGWLAAFIGAVLGAMLLLWLWQQWRAR